MTVKHAHWKRVLKRPRLDQVMEIHAGKRTAVPLVSSEFRCRDCSKDCSTLFNNFSGTSALRRCRTGSATTIRTSIAVWRKVVTQKFDILMAYYVNHSIHISGNSTPLNIRVGESNRSKRIKIKIVKRITVVNFSASMFRSRARPIA